ncbi:hypothetical protein Rhopal_000701-T1 [Rhodotorula paludigena]|uniref:Proteophosphoglycan ppg4 n=1 Tax=Rhodotorula paludigena TaxID=86838 RepID=A0AAV5GDR2_9BASI|nr:hypothetical protein Rhopal_000701-T1 [Rhodotorula paludigena]
MASAGKTLLTPSPARSSPVSAHSSSTSLVLTIRHLPTDRWLTFSAPKEWRIGQLKDAALVAFGESPPSQPPRRTPSLKEPVDGRFQTPRAGRPSGGLPGEGVTRENDVPDEPATGRRSSEGGGLRSVGRVASAMASKREKLRPPPVPTVLKEAKSRRREGAEAWKEDVSEHDKKEPGRWSGWCLVSAIKGGFGSDREIVGTHLLKPRILDYDPPLHLLHLPFLRIERVEVLVRLQDDLSFGEPERSPAPSTLKKRASLVGPKPQVELCEQMLEICVEGVSGWSGWNDDEVEGPIMVLRLHQDGQLVQVHCLPACSIRLDSPEPASPVLSPCTPTARKPVPAPSARSVVPLIHLDFDDGESLVFRPSSLDDYERVMRLVDNEDAMSEAAFEAEMKRRKNIIDTAYRAWHAPFYPVPLASASTRPPDASAAPAHVLPLSPLLSNMPIERRRSLNLPPPSSSRAVNPRPGLVKSFTANELGAAARSGGREGRKAEGSLFRRAVGRGGGLPSASASSTSRKEQNARVGEDRMVKIGEYKGGIAGAEAGWPKSRFVEDL